MLCAGSRKLTVRVLASDGASASSKWCLDSMGWLRLRGVEGSASMRRSVSPPFLVAALPGCPGAFSSFGALPPAPIVIDYRWGSMGSNETATATTGGPRVIMLLLPYFLLPQRRREIKLVLLRGSGVGKSSLAQRYVRAAARRRVIDVFSHSDTTIAAALAPTTAMCCYATRLGRRGRPLRRGSVSQK